MASLAPHQVLRTSDIFSVSHITCVLTGAGAGIGLMIAEALILNGVRRIYLIDKRKEALDIVAKLHCNGPGEVRTVVADISNKEDVLRLAADIARLEEHGIQLLINNAGIALDHATRFGPSHPELLMTSPESISQHFLKSEPEDWGNSFSTNVMGAFFMSMAFLPLLALGSQNSGLKGYTSSIINTSSNAAFLKDSCRGYVSYAASKAGTVHLTRMLATLFKDTGVRVNQIAPGTFPSEMTTGSSGPDQKSTMNRPVMNAAGRAGGESDIAATVLLLAGIGGTYYNGQILVPDGGETLICPAAI